MPAADPAPRPDPSATAVVCTGLDALLAALAEATGTGHWILLEPPDAAPDPERIARALGPARAAWARTLRDDWPPAVTGLHRIELAPGRAWLSIVHGAVDRRRAALLRALQAPRPASPDRRALVVGAGLAGCACADALVRRGWSVTVLEAATSAGGAVRDVPWLALHPALSPGPDRRSRLLLRALLVVLRLQARFGDALQRCGRFEPMPYAEAVRRAAGLPASVAQPVLHAEPARHGVAGPSGLWLPGGAVLDPHAWWRRVADRPGVTSRFGCRVARLQGAGAGADWQALDHDGRIVGTAPVVVLANQADAFALAGLAAAAHGPLRIGSARVRIGIARPEAATGQQAPERNHAATGSLAARPVIGGDRFRLERPGALCVVGPGGDDRDRDRRADRDSDPDEDRDAGRGTDPRAAEPPDPPPGYGDWRWSAPGLRLLLRDNLPMIGAVPDEAAIAAERDRHARNDRLPLPRRPGLHLLCGLGGRGALWAPLGAELIAAAVSGEPPLVEPELAEAVDPARFLRRALRRTDATSAERTGS
ncbi:MAG: FAD-dependent oxidoreductase [Lautropia sp.]